MRQAVDRVTDSRRQVGQAHALPMQAHQQFGVEVHAPAEAGLIDQPDHRLQRGDTETAHGVANIQRQGVDPYPDVGGVAPIKARLGHAIVIERNAVDHGIRPLVRECEKFRDIRHIMLAVGIDLQRMRVTQRQRVPQTRHHCAAFAQVVLEPQQCQRRAVSSGQAIEHLGADRVTAIIDHDDRELVCAHGIHHEPDGLRMVVARDHGHRSHTWMAPGSWDQIARPLACSCGLAVAASCAYSLKLRLRHAALVGWGWNCSARYKTVSGCTGRTNFRTSRRTNHGGTAKHWRPRASAQSSKATPGTIGAASKWPSNTVRSEWISSVARASVLLRSNHCTAGISGRSGAAMPAQDCAVSNGLSTAPRALPCALTGSASTKRQRLGKATACTPLASVVRSKSSKMRWPRWTCWGPAGVSTATTPTRAPMGVSTSSALASCTHGVFSSCCSMASSDTRFSSILTMRSARPSRRKPWIPAGSARSLVLHHAASGSRGEHTARQPSCSRHCTSENSCQESSALAHWRQAMPPVSELPKTSTGVWPRTMAAERDTSNGSGPPDENTHRRCCLTSDQWGGLPRRLRCAGLDTSTDARAPRQAARSSGYSNLRNPKGRPATSGQSTRNSNP